MDKTSFPGKLSLSGRARFSLATKILPIKRTPIRLLDSLEIAFIKPQTNQVTIDSILKAEVSSDLSLDKSEVLELTPCPEAPLTEDFTEWLQEHLSYPEIQSFPLLLDNPRRAGKSYQEDEKETAQIALFEDKSRCIHGLPKSWCSICIQKKRQERQEKAKSSYIDPFDLIFPVLQPPLGEDFDSPVAFPPGMELYPFQRSGVKFLIEHKRALLADEMGLGKSIQTIVAIRFLLRMGKVTHGLVLCPRSVLTDWERKFWEWAPEVRVVKVRGPKEKRRITWRIPGHVYITTYETLRQDLSGTLQEQAAAQSTPSLFKPDSYDNFEEEDESGEDIAETEFDFVVLDEIQKIKNPSAAITKATRKVQAPLRWGLSGTPLENRLEELVSIFAYLKPGLLRYDDAAHPQKVKRLITPHLLRRRKAEALPDLPEKIHSEKWLELLPLQREAYERAEQDGIISLNEEGDSVTVQHVLALITKLKQICNIHPITDQSCKLDYLAEKLEEISQQQEKALVFSQYPQKTLKLLLPKLEQFNPMTYDGTLSDTQRDRIVQGFQEEQDSRVLLMSVKAGGVGLTLDSANHVFHFDLWWNPSTAAQAEDRAHRIGQTKNVFVTSLLTVDTIEERIQNLLKRKLQLFETVIDDLSDTTLSKILTEDDLFGLFALKKATQSTQRMRGGSKQKPLILRSPQQFEELVADLYGKMGYQVKLTPATRDKGVDIYAKRLSETGTESLAIQCKHYPDRVVGVDHARSLYGVINDQPSLTRGILVTSGKFSSDCKAFSTGKRIELLDGEYLLVLLEKYQAEIN